MTHSYIAVRPPAQRGFTLIELMVTVTVLGVLLSLAVPSFAKLIAGNRITTQTNELISAFNLARSEAVRRGQAIAIRTDDDGIDFGKSWKVFTDSDADGAIPGTVTATNGTPLRESAAVSGGIAMNRVTRTGSAGSYTYTNSSAGDKMYVVFTSRGANNAGAAAFFKVCNAANPTVKGRIVQVSPVGKISLDSSNETCT